MSFVGDIVGGFIQADAVKEGSADQLAATEAGIAEQRRQFDLSREDFQPYREAGVQALGSLQGDIGRMPTAAEVMASPGYQFGMQQGQTGLDRRIAAMGGRVSGAALKAASRFNTDYATTGYNAEYQRRQDRLNRLAAIAGIGQTATSGSAQAGASAANNISSALQSQGDASAAARVAQGNIWGNAFNRMASTGFGSQPQQTDLSFFRSDDPYRNYGYFGGEEGE